MSDENLVELSPEQLAEISRATTEINQHIRETLAVGGSLELLTSALVNILGFPKDLVATLIEQRRNSLKREASVDRDFEVANTLARLDLLFTLAIRENDRKTALAVVRERTQFTGAAGFVKYATSEPSRKPSEFDRAWDEIGGAERYRLLQEVEKKALARADEMRKKDAAEKERVKTP